MGGKILSGVSFGSSDMALTPLIPLTEFWDRPGNDAATTRDWTTARVASEYVVHLRVPARKDNYPWILTEVALS